MPIIPILNARACDVAFAFACSSIGNDSVGIAEVKRHNIRLQRGFLINLPILQTGARLKNANLSLLFMERRRDANLLPSTAASVIDRSRTANLSLAFWGANLGQPIYVPDGSTDESPTPSLNPPLRRGIAIRFPLWREAVGIRRTHPHCDCIHDPHSL